MYFIYEAKTTNNHNIQNLKMINSNINLYGYNSKNSYNNSFTKYTITLDTNKFLIKLILYIRIYIYIYIYILKLVIYIF